MPTKGQLRYASRKAKGVCVQCGGAKDCEKVKCAKCRDKTKASYDLRSSLGICVRCGKQDQMTGRSHCEPCLAIMVKRIHGYETARLASGKCRHCTRNAEDGRQSCRRCRKARSIWAREAYHVKRLNKKGG